MVKIGKFFFRIKSEEIRNVFIDRGLEITTEQKGKNIATRPWQYTYGADGC